ncbi:MULTISPECIES: hypothetical protein [Nonomuraea]|uniref:Uncharacterized protein n=1 Tax=Nonomuraea composti TaxID=2720023 RepID=A0ABX1BGQ0_9ACTN|nr:MULTISPECIES: hypothetical protein [unclassified Nonomuraea]NJP94951.1 hypothetical protein [Nonomuraea sp. FMUSA5-5]
MIGALLILLRRAHDRTEHDLRRPGRTASRQNLINSLTADDVPQEIIYRPIGDAG